MKVTVQCQYVEGDFLEANAAARSMGFLSMGTISFFYLYLAYMTGTIVGNFLQRTAPGVPPRSALEIIISALPLMLAGAYWGWITFRRQGRRSPGFIRPPTQLTNMGIVLPLILAGGLLAVTILAGAFALPAPPPDPSQVVSLPEALFSVFTSFAPIIVMMICFVIMTVRLFHRSIRRAWDLQGHLRNPHTLEFSDEGINSFEAGCDCRYRWEGMIGWHETANVFVIYRSHATFVMVPKRAIPSMEAGAALVHLLRTRIGAPPLGFEIRASSPPPLPAVSAPPGVIE